jgi:methyltransferase
MLRAAIVAAAAFVPMLAEAARSRRNEATLRARGAIEPAGDVYPWMQVAYPACFVAMAAEAAIRRQPADVSLVAGAAVFILAKALKYSAIAALGDRWSFRVLVLPGKPLISSGPYRWMRHPNYVGVAGELIGAALMAGSPIAGVISFVTFGGIMLARIRVEDRALSGAPRARPPERSGGGVPASVGVGESEGRSPSGSDVDACKS